MNGTDGATSQDRVERVFELLGLTSKEPLDPHLWEAGSPIQPPGDEVRYVTRISNTSSVNREVNAELERRSQGNSGHWQHP